MNATIFKYASIGAVVLAATGIGAWYFLAPPEAAPAVVPRIEEPGTIEGTTAYPSDYVPAQKVCAQSATDPLYERCVAVPASEGTEPPMFAIKLPPGTYTVYAVLSDPADLGLLESRRAYWTEFVRCGLTVDCPSHARLEVVVRSGEATLDVRPHDWY